MCENDPKSIKTMGYSSHFLVKNGQKCMIFAPFKLIENKLKGVKMTQNRSKP
jgi:hypothetical protein